MVSSRCQHQTVDVFQASLLNLINGATDNGINNLYQSKINELHRFILIQYIHSLTPCHPLRSELIEHQLNEHQKLSYYENCSSQESQLKCEWTSLLNPKNPLKTSKTSENNPEKSKSPSLTLQNDEKEEDEPIDYRSISRDCWIYIVQYLNQKDKILILSKVNNFFNDLSSDNLVWRKLYLSKYQINVKIPWYHKQFEVFLSRSCTNIQSIQFEFLGKDDKTWQSLWKLLGSYCLAIKHIHIGLFHGIWTFEFNQLEPIYDHWSHSVNKHITTTTLDADDYELRAHTPYLPLERIECAPGVMPDHIVSLLQKARSLQHFFVPLIYNDADPRWDSVSFWNIPLNLPSTLKSFRGFDAKTPLHFVHQCIANLPNIEEFHVVLYFGSAHPDYIAASYNGETLNHLAANCHHLRSFEGYFDSTKGLLQGTELMIEACDKLKSIGFLFHPSVRELDIQKMISQILESEICKRYNPKCNRLLETPNPHVTLRVVEIVFDHSHANKLKKMICNGHHKQSNKSYMNGSPPAMDMLYGNISGENIKSLDEVDFDDEDEVDSDKSKMRNGHNHNCNDEDTKEQIWRDNNHNDSNSNKKNG